MEPTTTEKPVVADATQAGTGLTQDAPAPVDWAAHIPAEYRAEKIWETTFKGKMLGDVLKSTAEAQRLIGSSIRLPGEKDKPEDRSKRMGEIYDKLGRPKTADEYGPLKPQNIGEYIEWDSEFESSFKGAAHKLGLNKEQAAGLTSVIGEYLNKNMPNPVVEASQTKAALVSEWGEHGYAQNMTYANRAIETYGGKELVGLLAKSGLQNDPTLAKVFAKIGRELAEAGAISGEITIGGAQSEIDKIYADKTHPYFNRSHTDHEAAVERMLDLQRSVAVSS